jgi:hypothetical protein
LPEIIYLQLTKLSFFIFSELKKHRNNRRSAVQDNCYTFQFHRFQRLSFTLSVSLSSAGIFKQTMGARNRIGIRLSYRPARLLRLTELIPWNQYLQSENFNNFVGTPLDSRLNIYINFCLQVHFKVSAA